MIEQDIEDRREEEARQDADIYKIKVAVTNIQGNGPNKELNKRTNDWTHKRMNKRTNI